MGRGFLAKAAGKVAYCGLQLRSQMLPAASFAEGAFERSFYWKDEVSNAKATWRPRRLCEQTSV